MANHRGGQQIMTGVIVLYDLLLLRHNRLIQHPAMRAPLQLKADWLRWTISGVACVGACPRMLITLGRRELFGVERWRECATRMREHKPHVSCDLALSPLVGPPSSCNKPQEWRQSAAWECPAYSFFLSFRPGAGWSFNGANDKVMTRAQYTFCSSPAEL